MQPETSGVVKLLSGTDAQNWMLSRGWLRQGQYRIEPSVPAVAYKGGYDLSGIVCASMAEMFLTEMTTSIISSGVINIVRVFPQEPAALRVLRCLLDNALSDQVDGYGAFIGSYDRLVAALAWCLACEWEIDFIAAGCRFAFSSGDEANLRVYWPKDEAIAPTAEMALISNQFESVPA